MEGWFAMDYVSDHRALLAECPLWDPRIGTLFWVDIDGRSVHRLDPSTGREDARAIAGRPGSIALTDRPNRLLVAVEHEIGWLEWDRGTFEPWRALETEGTGNRLNDGRTDRSGRFWVGSMHTQVSDEKRTGLLHRVDPDGAHVTLRSGVGVSNGLAFSPDGRVMFYADTLEDTVWRYDYDDKTGLQSNEEMFTDFADLPGRPDGGCVDADGCYWIACVFGSAVARLTPAGRVDRVVDLPVEKPTMPAFGGADLATLFVTSIGGGGTHDLDPAQSDAGRLLALDVGVRGLADTPFGG